MLGDIALSGGRDPVPLELRPAGAMSPSMAPNTNMIAITVNGETRRVPENTSIAHLARMLELDPAKVAVECNRHVIPRTTLETVTLHEGDELEIVHFVGGGDHQDAVKADD